MVLKELELGKWARIISVGGSGALRQHFLDMGIRTAVRLRFSISLPKPTSMLEMREKIKLIIRRIKWQNR